MVSKALVLATYRQKLTELARLGVEVLAVVPPAWGEGGSQQRLEELPAADYQLIVSPIRLSGHFHLHYYPELPRLIKRTRPDVVHVDEEPYNLATYLGVQAARRAALPSLFFSWQNLLRRYPPPFAQMERTVYRHAAHALAGSQTVATVLRKKGYAGPTSVVPQFGVDPEIFRPAPRRDGCFTVGFLNRLVPAKSPLSALEAFQRLPVETRLQVVGDGPLRDQFQAEVDRRGLGGRVSVQQRVPSHDMPHLLQRMDVVLLPSVTTSRWKEQFGRILIEAMACGVPVIASDSGEIPEVVSDAGLIVPEGDVMALTRALLTVYQDPQLRARLGGQGRKRVLDRFTHVKVARQTYEAYMQAVSYRT